MYSGRVVYSTVNNTDAARGCSPLRERGTTADELEVRLGQSFVRYMVLWDWGDPADPGRCEEIGRYAAVW